MKLKLGWTGIIRLWMMHTFHQTCFSTMSSKSSSSSGGDVVWLWVPKNGNLCLPCRYLFENGEGKALMGLLYYNALGHSFHLKKALWHQVVQSFYFMGVRTRKSNLVKDMEWFTWWPRFSWLHYIIITFSWLHYIIILLLLDSITL